MDNPEEEILAHLEQLANDLDSQQYPGQAWSATASATSRRKIWKVASLIVVAAATLVLIIHFLGLRLRQNKLVPMDQNVVIRDHTPSNEYASGEFNVPVILVVEDHDSYSFIDLMPDVPLVSFASKDTYTADYVMPLLPDAAQQLPSEKEM